MNTAAAGATPNAKTSRFGGWFRRARSGIDSLPVHLPVRLGGAGITQTKAAPMRVLGFDQALVWVTVALLTWGLVMVYSASIALPDNPRFARAGYSASFFLTRQAASVVCAVPARVACYVRAWHVDASRRRSTGEGAAGLRAIRDPG